MAALGEPDVWTPDDPAVRTALGAQGLDAGDHEAWTPWRTYALHHLWRTLHADEETTA